jgi:hypothetical protein
LNTVAGPGVIAFHATYAVLKAEKTLKGLGIGVKMIPVPRQISSNCGIAIRFTWADRERVLQAIDGLREDLEGIYHQTADGSFERLPDIPAS